MNEQSHTHHKHSKIIKPELLILSYEGWHVNVIPRFML